MKTFLCTNLSRALIFSVILALLLSPMAQSKKLQFDRSLKKKCPVIRTSPKNNTQKVPSNNLKLQQASKVDEKSNTAGYLNSICDNNIFAPTVLIKGENFNTLSIKDVLFNYSQQPNSQAYFDLNKECESYVDF